MMHFLIVSLDLVALACATAPPLISSKASPSSETFRQELNSTGNTTLLLTPANSTNLNASNNFPDPFDFVVEANVFEIEFYGYQGSVRYTDLSSCVYKANTDIIQKLSTGQGFDRMGTHPYSWSDGDLALYLSPGEQLTWAQWALAPSAIRRFVEANGLRGTQFFLLWHTIGYVGYGELVVEPENTHPPTTAATTTIPDPCDRRYDVGLTIEFYGYGDRVDPVAASDCIADASRDVGGHFLTITDPMTAHASSYSYSRDGVNLFLTPSPRLRWYMWAAVPIWIQEFVAENGFRGTQFILLWDGLGPVGTGQLVSTAAVSGLDVE